MTSAVLLPFRFCGEAVSQVTWVFGECGPTPRAESYSVDSFVPGDPAAPGLRMNTVTVTGLGPAVNQLAGDGGVAVDKINKVVYFTDGNAAGGILTYTIAPTSASCSPGNGGTQTTLAVGGTYPFQSTWNVTGIAIEYWTNPSTQVEEPFRMWAAAADPSVTNGAFSWWWLTSNPPNYPSEQPNTWYAGTLTAGTRRWGFVCGFPVRDIAFGIVSKYQGSTPGPPLPCLFSLDPNSNFMDVTDVSNLLAGGGGVRCLYSVPTQFAPGKQLGIAIDTSIPQDWGPSNPPFWGPQRQLSGRVLIYGLNGAGSPLIQDNNYSSSNPSIIQWNPPSFCALGSTYVAGMDYSAEMVSLGLPTGRTCPGGTGGGGTAPSTARADLFQLPSANPSLPGQPLVRVLCPTYQNPVLSCTTNAVAATFEIEACNVPVLGGPYTPYLLIQKNGVSPVVINGQSIIVNPNSPSVKVLAGTINGAPPPQVFEASLFTNGSLASPTTPIPHVVVPVPAAPVWHYYYAQWVFVCGQQVPFPSNLSAATFFTSEPIRIAMSNPH